MLEDTLVKLADLFRDHGEVRLADGLEGMLTHDTDQLPREVLDLFTHGMGGIFDPALYKDGELDREASERRTQLAEQLFQEARAGLE